MTTLHTAAKQALDALERCTKHTDADYDAMTALRSALAAPMPEPVAWGMARADGLILDVITPEEHESYAGEYTVPLCRCVAPAPVVPTVHIGIKASEWETLSPEAQDLIRAAGQRAADKVREQRIVDGVARAAMVPIPLDGSAAPVVREPLTTDQVVDAFCKLPHKVQYVAIFQAGVDFAEAHHGIGTTGGNHG